MTIFKKAIAKHYHAKIDKIISTTEKNIDELCKSADEYEKLINSFNALPEWLRQFIGNSKASELV